MYEQGRREPSIKTLVALSKVLGVSLDFLITGSESTSHNTGKIAGVLFILQADLPSASETILLGESDLIKVISALHR